jgi:hypothetical protein
MNMQVVIFLTVISTLLLIVIVQLLRRNLMPPSAALFWLVLGIVIVTIPLFSSAYDYVAKKIFGFYDATNVIYVLLIGLLILYSIYTTIKLKQSSDRVQILLSQVAIIDAEMRRRLDALESMAEGRME